MAPADPAPPRVIEGRDGWLYLGEELARACRPRHSVGETLARLRRLVGALTAAGRRFVLVVAPDKTSIVPEHLPARYAGGCAVRRRQEFWRRFRADNPVPGFVDLAPPLARLHAASREPVYRRLDTHWTPRGAVVYTMALAQALDPGLWPGATVLSTGTRQLGGDLSQLLGRRDAEPVAGWEIRRPGVTGNFDEISIGAAPTAVTNTSTGAALFAPRTALLVDSFSLKQISGSAIFSLFADAVALFSEAATASAIADAIRSSDVVVAEVAERFLVSGDSSLLADGTLAAIEAAVPPSHRPPVTAAGR